MKQAKALEASPEANHRLLVGRAYYACYHRCQEWEKTLPHLGSIRPDTKGVHQELIDRLQRPHPSCSPEQFKRSKWLGKRLLKLRNLRVCADYRLEDELTEVQTKLQVEMAEAVFNRCDWDRSQIR
ncbi:hypothetical protein [Roseateles sp. L2-2]|uniref:hypothetical protein n=1 Tax=Roseateles TaxID=93681 RepID=UPI003D360F95